MKKILFSTMALAVVAGVSAAPSQAASTLFESKDILTPTEALGRFQWLDKCYQGLLLEVADQMFDPTVPMSNEQKIDSLKNAMLYTNGVLRQDATYLTFGNDDNENPSDWRAGTSSAQACTQIPSDYGVSSVMVSPSIPQYCTASARDKDYEYIKEVSFANLSNSSGAANYSNYVGQAAKIYKDTAYEVTLTPGFVIEGDSYPESWRIFIDWNRDGDFSDASETHYVGLSDTTIKYTLTPPAGTVPGLTKMRVTMDFYGGKQDPCLEVNSGEVEDYLVYIK